MSEHSSGGSPFAISAKSLGSLKACGDVGSVSKGIGPAHSEPAFNAKAAEAAALASADHDGLYAMLRDAVAAQWEPMVLKTVDLGRGFSRIENILERMAEKFKDERARTCIAFINDIADTPDKLYKPRAKNYPPRGLPCVLKICEEFELHVPREKVEAILESVRLQDAVQEHWDAGRAAMGRWMSLTAA